MKKTFLLKLFATVMLMCLSIAMLTACENVNVEVTFIVDDEVYAVVNLQDGDTVEMPQEPTKDGYVFDGWYLDKDIWKKPFIGKVEDTTLVKLDVYAKWVEGETQCNHMWSQWTVGVEPTCSAEGKQGRYCLKCSKTEVETLPKLDHGEVLISETPATCTTTGQKEIHCRNCDKDFSEVIPALGHDYEVKSETQATCEAQGERVYVCTHDETHTYNEIIPALGHNYEFLSQTVPTCTEKGKIVYKCSNCDGTETIVIDELGHSLGNDGKCTNCDYQSEKHEHKYTTEIVAPTCSSVGYTYYECSCGLSYKDNYIEQLAHKWNGGEITVAATCAKDGVMQYSCTREGCTAKYDEVIKASHNWSETKIEPATCLYDGKIYKTCLSCGAEDVEIIAATHTWQVETVIKQATCTEKGKESRKCSVCEKEEDFETDMLGHNYQNGVCSRCGGKFIDNVTPDSEHPTYGMYFVIDDIKSAYGPNIINEYGVLLCVNPEAKLDRVAVYLTQVGNMWRRCIACTGTNIEYAIYVPYLSYYENIYYTGLNSRYINTFALSKGKDGIWRYSEYATIGVNLEDYKGNLLLSLYDIGQAGAKTRIFDDLAEMIAWLKGYGLEHVHTPVTDEGEAASCTSGGYTEGSHCSECDEIIVKREYISALGHDFELGVCTRCGVRDPNYVSGGLAYSLNSDNESYSVVGIGTCTDTDVVIPAIHNEKPVTIIGKKAFCNQSGLIKITIPNSVTSIGEYAFAYCSELTSVTIGNRVTTIGYRAFCRCKCLTNIAIPNSVISIEERAFEYCDSLTSVTIGNNVTSINEYAFAWCNNLMNVIIPDSLAFIGEHAFTSCDNLQYNEYDKALYLGNKNNPYVALIKAKDYFITSCTISEKNKLICYNAFYGCRRLTNITIPDSVTFIDEAFSCCGLTSIAVNEGNTKYHSKNNCLIETESKTLISGCKNSIIPDDGSVTSIGMSAFYGCSALTNITIPDSVTVIGNRAFELCDSLTSITISNSVAFIGYCAFDRCYGLTSITIPDSVTSIDWGAFNRCNGLTSVTIGNGVTSIGSGVFSECNNLQYNEYDNALYLGNENNPYLALIKAKDESIISCTINDKTKIIANNAFWKCGGLTSITIPNRVTSIGSGAFSSCSGLTSITIPDSVTSIDSYAFSSCSGLTSVTIGNGVTSIGDQAFSRCENLAEIKFDGTVVEWNAVTKSSNWNYDIPAKKVICTDGEVEL